MSIQHTQGKRVYNRITFNWISADQSDHNTQIHLVMNNSVCIRCGYMCIHNQWHCANSRRTQPELRWCPSSRLCIFWSTTVSRSCRRKLWPSCWKAKTFLSVSTGYKKSLIFHALPEISGLPCASRRGYLWTRLTTVELTSSVCKAVSCSLVLLKRNTKSQQCRHAIKEEMVYSRESLQGGVQHLPKYCEDSVLLLYHCLKFANFVAASTCHLLKSSTWVHLGFSNN